MSDYSLVLRIYSPEELADDGYPHAWHGGRRVTARGPGGVHLGSHWIGEVDRIPNIIRALAGYRCERCRHPYRSDNPLNSERSEWTPCDELCGPHGGPYRWLVDGEYVQQENGSFGPTRREAQWRILTVHHLNGVKWDCRWWNLPALCQRCHLSIQGRVIMERTYILEHSEWFKPFAAGWYAEKYLGEDITRAEALGRMDELLALEQLA